MTFAFFEQHAGTWPVRLMCRVLDVSHSGYNGWRSRSESAQATSNRQLIDDVQRMHTGYIEGDINRQRIHSALRYITPEQAERNAS
ncbi:hypothetical protein G3T14_04570 [Methylobacterium sp. BTF04]|uniref:hypothetical protein n=1 Tax=Methylobacterium sp. BTF04 TaxID=2708300 RepID=UPI0013D71372|nr:hypothetical protein [Methylobacterium sp. BTF04]NEU11399.1 hypothetical protein [Methylobacterium sp. BTF04]